MLLKKKSRRARSIKRVCVGGAGCPLRLPLSRVFTVGLIEKMMFEPSVEGEGS